MNSEPEGLTGRALATPPRLELHDSLETIRQVPGWYALSDRSGLFESDPWLEFTESEASLTSRYSAVYDRGELGAVVPARAWDGTPNLLAQECEAPLRALSRSLRVDERTMFPALIVGALGGYTNDLAGVHRLLSSRHAKALTETWEAMAHTIGTRTIIVPNLTTAAVDALRTWLSDRIVLLAAEPAAYFDVQWGSFDAYLASLSQRRRASARNEMRAFEVQCRASEMTLHDSHMTLAPLLSNLQFRHGISVPRHSVAAFLSRMAASSLDRFGTVLSAAVAQQIIGSCLLFDWGRVQYVYKVGFDYGQSRSVAAYFNLGYYLPLRRAINQGSRIVCLGPGALRTKLLRGASLETRWFALLDVGLSQRVKVFARAWNQVHYARLANLLHEFRLSLAEPDESRFRSLAE